MNALIERAQKAQYLSTIPLTRKSTILLYLGITISLLAFLALRVGNPNLLTASLWAEDGPIFFDQSTQGLESLWTAYAGYIHLYPRLVALLAKSAPLLATPIIFNTAWLCAYLVAGWALLHYALKHTQSPFIATILCLGFSFTPQSGETLLTLTNSQWYIGIALLLYMCNWDTKHLGGFGNILLAVATLTGPFVILGLPFAIYIAVVSRGLAKSRTSYAILLIGACIQAMALITNGRPNSTAPIDLNLTHWLYAIQTYFTFGKHTWLSTILSLAFWATGLAVISRHWPKLRQDQKHTLIALILLASTCFLAGLSAAKHEPHTLNPLGIGARYYLIPYILSFMSIAICLPCNWKYSLLLIATFSPLSYLFFCTLDRGEFQWEAYARLAEKAPDVSIPLAPNVPSYPGWSAHPRLLSAPGKSHNIDLTALSLVGLQRTPVENELISTNTDNQTSFRIDRCKGSPYIGIALDIERSNADFLQIFWARGYEFTERNSLRRFYPGGHAIAHFAFHNSQNNDTVRIDLSESPGKIRLNRIQIYCLN